MRKKQAFAVLLAACMTISCIPFTAYAAEPGEVSQFGEQIDTDTDVTPPGDDDGEPTPTPVTPQAPAEGAETTPAAGEEPKEEPTDAPKKEEAAPQENLKETETPDTPGTEENKVVFIGETGYKTLAEAVAAAAATTEKKADILLKGDLEISEAVEIPNDVAVTIAASKDVKITRSAGAKGYTFKIAEKGSLTLKKEDSTGKLAIVGAAKADSPLFQVDGKLAITAGVAISGNHSTGTAGAIFNKGTVTMTGGAINNNSSDNGGAIRNEGILEISGNVDISGNFKLDKKTKSNVALANGSVATVSAKLGDTAKIGLYAVDAKDGLTVVKAGKDVTLSENLGKFTYDTDDGTKINSEGALEDVPEEPTKDVTAPTLKKVSAERISDDIALITFRSDEAGTYYVSIDDPDVDTTGKGTKLSENVNMEYQAEGLAKGEHTAYIVAVDAAGNESNPLAISIPAMEREVLIADKSKNTINGIASSYDMNYLDKKTNTYKYYVSFSVTGAGMEFPDEEGNIRYEPVRWSIGGLKKEFKGDYKGYFTGTVNPGTYDLTVEFEQKKYNGMEWVATGEIDTKVAKIVLNKTITPTPTKKAATTNTKTNKSNTKDSGTNKTSSVSTGDETNAVPILFLGGSAAALAAAMAIMKKKRSKEEE